MKKNVNFNQEFISSEAEDQIELNHLKKFNHKMNKLKILLILLLLLVLSISTSFIIRYKYNDYVIDNAFQKIQSLRNVDNYKLSIKSVYTNYNENSTFTVLDEYYYKDGKCKLQSTGNYKCNLKDYNSTTTRYIEDESTTMITIFDDLKSFEIGHYISPQEKKGERFNIFSDIITYNSGTGITDFFLKSAVSIRSDIFNGIDCYVIRFTGNEEGYRENWISKTTFIPVRVLEESYTSYMRDTIYSIEFDVVADNDVNLDMSNYTDYRVVEYEVSNDAKGLYRALVTYND